MVTKKTKDVDVIYIRKIGFIGSVLLMGITCMNLFVETGTYDYPLPRVLLAISILLLAILSYKKEWVKEYGLQILYIHFFIYNFYGIALVAINNFQPIDTSATIIIGFALGAFIKHKRCLNAYLFFLLATYLGFFFTTENAVVSSDYFFLVLFFILAMGFMIFNGKIDADRIITESKLQLENSEKRFRSIFEKSPVGIMLLDLKLNPFRINNVLENLLGYTQEEFLQLNRSDYVHEDDFFESNDLLELVLKNEENTLASEQRFIKKNGNIIWIRLTMALVKTGTKDERYIVSMMEDITFQKQANVKLKDYANKLEVHNKALEEFSYVISHDLQEPLRMIRSYTGLIKRRYIDKLGDKNAEIDMSYVIDGAERMSNLIRDMLTYSRWSAKPYDKEVVDTRDILVDVIKNLTISITEKDGEIICSDMPNVMTNRVLFGQVLQNLIGNGLKYSFENRSPRIRIHGENRDFDVLFSIKDNGQGFEDRDKERIFGIFQRLHGRESAYKGTGIGLAICKRIVEKQGGKIWAEGEKGKGATFYFTMPKVMDTPDMVKPTSARIQKRKPQLQQ